LLQLFFKKEEDNMERKKSEPLHWDARSYPPVVTACESKGLPWLVLLPDLFGFIGLA